MALLVATADIEVLWEPLKAVEAHQNGLRMVEGIRPVADARTLEYPEFKIEHLLVSNGLGDYAEDLISAGKSTVDFESVICHPPSEL